MMHTWMIIPFFPEAKKDLTRMKKHIENAFAGRFEQEEHVVYVVCIIRQILIPIGSILLLYLFPADFNLKQVLLIAAACPVGANVAVYAQLYDKDYAYAGKNCSAFYIACSVDNADHDCSRECAVLKRVDEKGNNNFTMYNGES